MIGTSLSKRLGRLEALTVGPFDGDDGQAFHVDIGVDPPIHTIDGVTVEYAEFARRCPSSGYGVDIGEDGDL